ncbi:MAG: dephospho-CoA kinase [Bacteroidales bacterium]
MIKVGLTGGIGSGKTTVANIFIGLGIPVYFADPKAQELMTSDEGLVSDIRHLLGSPAYTAAGEINKPYVANLIFKSADKRKKLNALIGPVLQRDFDNWCSSQLSPYVIQEAAILFETGSYKKFHKVILVTAPESVRISRVSRRDNLSPEQVMQRMNSQWKDERKAELADYKLANTDLHELRTHVLALDQELRNLDAP